jgi:hypothetical protein
MGGERIDANKDGHDKININTISDWGVTMA